MRRFSGHVLALGCALSLLLFAATSILWVRSYSRSDWFFWRRPHSQETFYSARGHLVLSIEWVRISGELSGLTYRRAEAFPANRSFGFMRCPDEDVTNRIWERGGFEWHQWRHDRDGFVHVTAIVPCWAVATAAAAMPFVRAAGWLRRQARQHRRKTRGLCGACGYDVRFSPERCPECGAPTRAREPSDCPSPTLALS